MLEKYKKILSEVPEKERFRTDFGEISSLRELRTTLYQKGKKFFKQYVNDTDNHFANWVEGVFNDVELASALRNIASFGKTIKVLDDRIRYLELWMVHNKEKEELIHYLASNYEKYNITPSNTFNEVSDHNLSAIKQLFGEEPSVTTDNVEKQLEEFKNQKPNILKRIFKRNAKKNT